MGLRYTQGLSSISTKSISRTVLESTFIAFEDSELVLLEYIDAKEEQELGHDPRRARWRHLSSIAHVTWTGRAASFYPSLIIHVDSFGHSASTQW